jgi:KaiC/GvpD/RAD55 family RecA-like ATPase
MRVASASGQVGAFRAEDGSTIWSTSLPDGVYRVADLYPTHDFGKEGNITFAVMELLNSLRAQTDCTSLIIMDLRVSTLEREYQMEEYLTHGTIILQTISQPETGLTRVILIQKMRGKEHDTQPRPYIITNRAFRFRKEKST